MTCLFPPSTMHEWKRKALLNTGMCNQIDLWSRAVENKKTVDPIQEKRTRNSRFCHLIGFHCLDGAGFSKRTVTHFEP